MPLFVALAVQFAACSSSQPTTPDAGGTGLDAGLCSPVCGPGGVCVRGTCAPCDCGALQCGTICGRSCGECLSPKTCNSTTGLCEGGGSPCDGVVCQTGETCNATSGVCGCTANSCPGNQVCSSTNRCACPAGQAICGNTCVNTANDPQHCGSCDKSCSTSEVCGGSTCVLVCQSGTTACSGSCVDLSSDPQHCLHCDTPCPASASCHSGQCVEPADASAPAPDASALREDAALPGADASTAGPDASAPVCANDGGSGSGTPAWKGDYQTSLLTGWQPEQQLMRTAQQAIVTSPSRCGYPYSARFIVAPGDYTNGGTSAERSEIYASVADTGNPVNGQTMWWAWSFFLPTGFQLDGTSGQWFIMTQFHSSSSGGNPNIAFGATRDAAPKLLMNAKGDSGVTEWTSPSPIPLNQWNDIVLGVTWSTTPSTGRVTIKMNGTTLVNNAACSNLYSGYSAYLKQGIYRGASSLTHTIYYTGTRRGTTEASVAF